jgi:IclR helix-turn-helix domain
MSSATSSSAPCNFLSVRFWFYENKLSDSLEPFAQGSTGVFRWEGNPGAVGLSEWEVSLGLTASQVAQVLAGADADAESGALLAALARPAELTSSPLVNDRKVSRSLLFGLVVLICFPANGSERGVKEVAQELDLPTSTTHRYIHTLHAVGLLERDSRTRRYRRAKRSATVPPEGPDAGSTQAGCGAEGDRCQG